MRVWNLTNRPTPALRQFGLVDCTFAIGTRPLAPGASLGLEAAEAHLPLQWGHLIKTGALYVGDVAPEGYAETPVVTAVAEVAAVLEEAPKPAPHEKKKADR